MKACGNRPRAKDSRRHHETENYDDDDDNTAEDETPDGRRYPLRNRRHTNVYQGMLANFGVPVSW